MWRVDTIRPTVQAVHFLLSQGLSELHVAVAGTDVIEEPWRVSNDLSPTNAWAVAEELSSLGWAIESAMDDLGEVLIRLDKLREESGPHARRRLDLLRWLDTFPCEAFDVAQRLPALSQEADDLGDHLYDEKSP